MEHKFRLLAQLLSLGSRRGVCFYHSSSRLHAQTSVPTSSVLPFSQIPGPSVIPFINLSPSLLPGGRLFSSNYWHMLLRLRKEYGPIFRVLVPFRRPLVFITDVKDIGTVFRNEGTYPIRDEFQAFIHYKRSINQGSGLAASEGEDWKLYRLLGQKVLGGPQSATAYLDRMNDLAEIVCHKIVDTRSEQCEIKDFIELAKKWSFETMNNIVLGNPLGIFDNNSDASELFEATMDFFETSTELERIPPIWKLYPIDHYKRLTRASDIMHQKCYGYVMQAMDNPVAGSMLAKMIEVIDGEQTKNRVIDLMIDLLVSSIDTTSTTLTYVLHHLALHPDKQDLARQEMRHNMKNQRQRVIESDLNAMPYMKACLKETLRCRAVAAGTGRVLPCDLTLSGYHVPEGTKVIVLSSMASLEENNFQEADKFLPERWLRTSTTYKPAPRWSYLPFGHGPRACIGRRLAETEVWVMTTHLLRQFRVATTTAEFDVVMKLINLPDRPVNMVFRDL